MEGYKTINISEYSREYSATGLIEREVKKLAEAAAKGYNIFLYEEGTDGEEGKSYKITPNTVCCIYKKIKGE